MADRVVVGFLVVLGAVLGVGILARRGTIGQQIVEYMISDTPDIPVLLQHEIDSDKFLRYNGRY